MSILIEVDGFTRFRVTQDADGKTSFLGTAKIKGATYFFTSNDLLLPDGTHGLAAVRWETFTGKTVRGSANVLLEDLTDVVREATASWAEKNCDASPKM
jgi:hypothetical protein